MSSRSRSPSTTPRSPPRSELPDSAATELTAGPPVTAFVRVSNNGTTPEAYFVDPRLNKQVTLNLAAQSTPSQLTLPNRRRGAPVPGPVAHDRDQGRCTASAPLFFDITLPLR